MCKLFLDTLSGKLGEGMKHTGIHSSFIPIARHGDPLVPQTGPAGILSITALGVIIYPESFALTVISKEGQGHKLCYDIYTYDKYDTIRAR